MKYSPHPYHAPPQNLCYCGLPATHHDWKCEKCGMVGNVWQDNKSIHECEKEERVSYVKESPEDIKRIKKALKEHEEGKTVDPFAFSRA